MNNIISVIYIYIYKAYKKNIEIDEKIIFI